MDDGDVGLTGGRDMEQLAHVPRHGERQHEVMADLSCIGVTQWDIDIDSTVDYYINRYIRNKNVSKRLCTIL
jgi:hypothetical protein